MDNLETLALVDVPGSSRDLRAMQALARDVMSADAPASRLAPLERGLQRDLDALKAAADAGFKGVEYLFPYDYEADRLVAALEGNGLVQVLHNMPPGDWAAGERGLASLPDRVGEFQDSVGKAIEYAKALGCPQVNCLAGIPGDGVAPEKAHGTFVENLKFAAPQFEAAGIKLLIDTILLLLNSHTKATHWRKQIKIRHNMV